MQKIPFIIVLFGNLSFGQCPILSEPLIDDVCFELILDRSQIEGSDLSDPQFYTNLQVNSGVLLPFGTVIDFTGFCTLPDGTTEILDMDPNNPDRFLIYIYDTNTNLNCSDEIEKSILIEERSFFTFRSITVCPEDYALNINLFENAPDGFGNGTFQWVASEENPDVSGESTAINTGSTIDDILNTDGRSNQTVDYIVTPTSETGCVGQSYTVQIFIPELPLADQENFNRSTCSATALDLILDNFVFRFDNTFVWSAEDNTNVAGESITDQTSNTIEDTLINLTDTDQTVVYTITPSNGFCTAPDFKISVIVEACTLDIEDYANFYNTTVYPNPTKDHIIIKNAPAIMVFKVLNLNGQIILNGKSQNIDLQSLQKGMYILKLSSEGGHYISKVVKY